MKNTFRILFFVVIGFMVGLGFTVLFTDGNSTTDQAANSSNQVSQDDESNSSTNAEETNEDTSGAIPVEYQVFEDNSCLSCHSVDSLNLKGGEAGPDLSTIYSQIEDKRGVTLDEFLQNPSSAVMSSVIGGNPLSDEEREQIVNALQEASAK